MIMIMTTGIEKEIEMVVETEVMIEVVFEIEKGRVTEIEKEEEMDILDIEQETIMNTTLKY
jgi:hypothetical protein